jgi:hypothetical protein
MARDPSPQVRPTLDEVDELLLLRWHEDDGLDRELREWSPVSCVFDESLASQT